MTNAFKVNNLHAGESRTELSKQWATRPYDERYLSLDDLAKSVGNRVRRETVVDLSDIEVYNDARNPMMRSPNGNLYDMTHWSFGQVAQIAGAPASYLRSLSPKLATRCLSEGLSKNAQGRGKVYFGEGKVHAVTSPTYGRIYDSDVVSCVQKIAGNGTGDTDWKIPGQMDWSTMIYDSDSPVTKMNTTLYASDRDVWMFLVDDRNPIEVGVARNGEPDVLFRGFYVSNSEVGAGTLQLACFYLRSLCCNRIMWGVEGFREIRMRHSKYAPEKFLREIIPALQEFTQSSTSRILNGVRAAQSRRVAENDEQLEVFLRGLGLSVARTREVLEVHMREELRPVETVWDCANGITAVARGIEYTDERVGLELVAKKLLDKVI